MEKALKAVVLAAGRGARMQQDGDGAPKVMREVCGKPLLFYVLNALSFIRKQDIIIVVGYKKEAVTDCFTGYTYAEQTEQLGTGHAVLSAAARLRGFEGSVLVCCGDMPAVREETYKALAKEHFKSGGDCTVLTGESQDPRTYGRIVRSNGGGFLRVVEEKDCTPAQLAITEINSGVYLFRARPLLTALGKLDRENAQGEYYLTDTPRIILDGGGKVGALKRDLGGEIAGVNTPEQLEAMTEILRCR